MPFVLVRVPHPPLINITMISFKEFCESLLSHFGYNGFEYDDVISFTQTFSSTACRSNAIGGQIPTSGQVFIFLNYKREAIVIGPAWGYHISNFTDAFVKDLYNHRMAGTSNITKIQEYGTISLITSFN